MAESDSGNQSKIHMWGAVAALTAAGAAISVARIGREPEEPQALVRAHSPADQAVKKS